MLSSIERDKDKIELPERTALTFWDSFAMGQYMTMLETAAAGQQAQGERAQIDVAMTQAATDEGLNRQELAVHSRRASEAHAQSIAQEIARRAANTTSGTRC